MSLLYNRISQPIIKKAIEDICLSEYEMQVKRPINERSIEYRFVFQKLTELMPCTVLDVGTGESALPALMKTCGFMVTATDNIVDYWKDGMMNRHFHVINDDITKTGLSGEYDLITCVSVLEHIESYREAVQSMFLLLKQGGNLIMTFPYNSNNYVKNVYELPDSFVGPAKWPFITQAFSDRELNEWLKALNGKLIEQEFWQFFTGEYWTVGEYLPYPKQVSKDELHHLTCIHIRKQ